MPHFSSDTKFKFPTNEDYGLKWIAAVASEKLNGLPYKDISGKYYVCARHFETRYIATSTKGHPTLLKNGFPTLHLNEGHAILNETSFDHSLHDANLPGQEINPTFTDTINVINIPAEDPVEPCITLPALYTIPLEDF